MALFDDDIVPDEIEEIDERRKDSSKQQAEWRKEARECFAFVAGDQWDADDKASLEENSRPCVTFNRVGPVVDAIVGYETNNRRTLRYMPRTMQDQQLNEIYTQAAQWVRDRCDAEDEETDAFRDAVVSGMGWLETRVDYELEDGGQIVMERVSPLEMRWDPSARKNNLDDAEWLIREKWLDLSEVRKRWPEKGKEITLADANNSLVDAEWTQEHDASRAWEYRATATSWWDPSEGKALVIQYQWREREAYYVIGDEESGRTVEFSAERFERIRDRITMPYVRKTKWVHKQRITCGQTILEEGDAPISGGFSFRCITGKRDERTGLFYGLVRAMLDPQRWANVFFSQAMGALQANSKGGLIIEESAVNDIRQLEEKWADPSGIITVNDGALTSGALTEKSFGGYPPALDKLMEFAINSIRDCTGVNMEMLGMVGHEQTGMLEVERKKSALTILAPIINSVRRYRKIQGGDLLEFMRQYITPGTIMRVTDREVPFWGDDENVKYDVVVSDADSSPNLKNEVWQSLQNILPAALRTGMPIPPQLIKFSPLPSEVADEWIQYIEKMSGMPDMGQIQQQGEQMQAEIQKLQKENMQLKDKREAQAMQIQARQAEAALEAQIKEQQMALEERMRQSELTYKMKMSDADRAAKLLEIEARYDTEMERIREQGNVQRETSNAQIEVQREQAVINLQSEREKRAAERADREAETGMPKQVEKLSGDVQEALDVGKEFEQYREEMRAKRQVVLDYLKTRGGAVADLAERLEA